MRASTRARAVGIRRARGARHRASGFATAHRARGRKIDFARKRRERRARDARSRRRVRRLRQETRRSTARWRDRGARPGEDVRGEEVREKGEAQGKKAAQKAVDALLPRESAFPRSSSDAPVRMGAASGGMMTHRPYRPNPSARMDALAAAWGAISACAWVALKIVNGENPVRKIGGAIGGVFKGGSRPPPPGARGPGRWVGDRSLGGRQVWVRRARIDIAKSDVVWRGRWMNYRAMRLARARRCRRPRRRPTRRKNQRRICPRGGCNRRRNTCRRDGKSL